MKLFKNYKTRKQLLKELTDLQEAVIRTGPTITHTSHNVRKIHAVIPFISGPCAKARAEADIANMISGILLNDNLIDFKVSNIITEPNYGTSMTVTGTLNVLIKEDKRC